METKIPYGTDVFFFHDTLEGAQRGRVAGMSYTGKFYEVIEASGGPAYYVGTNDVVVMGANHSKRTMDIAVDQLVSI